MPRHTNVREPLTALRGRDALVERVHAQLDEGARWLTLLGPPGVGKSRVLTAVAAGIAPRECSGGVWMTSLSAAHSESEICARIAFCLPGVFDELPREFEQLVPHLQRLGPLLLVLDDAEHVAEPLSRLVPRLLERVRSMRCLIGTRERLGAPGEVVVEVEPLTPDAAVELFIERAEAVRGTRLNESERSAASQLVHRLDCLPLAVELAASQLAVVSVAELSASLEASVLSLRSLDRGVRARHASLDAALDVSWGLLSDAQRAGLSGLALFEESTEASAWMHVVDVDVPTLAGLRDRSWLKVERLATTRYGLLGVVRDFVRDRAPADAATMQRYVESVTILADRLVRRWGDRTATRELCRVAPDLRNAAQHGASARVVVALARVALVRGPVDEALERLGEVAIGPDTIDAVVIRGRLHSRSGHAGAAHDDFERAYAMAQQAEDPSHVAYAASALADHLRHHGNPTRAQQLYREALAYEGLQSRARVFASLAGLLAEQGELVEARELYSRAIAVARAANDALLAAAAQQNLGLLLQEEGELEDARTCFKEALHEHRELGNRRFEAIAHLDLAGLALEQGRALDALDEASKALALIEQAGDRREQVFALLFRGVALASTDELDAARVAFEHAERLRGQLAQPGIDAAFAIHASHVELARARLSHSDPTVSVPDAPAGDDARLAARILRRALERAEEARDAIQVAADGSWFQTSEGERVDLESRAALRQLMACLAETRRRDPDALVSVDALIAAGWPERRSATKAAKNRLHVALATLRKLGVGDHLERVEGGYRLVGAWVRD